MTFDSTARRRILGALFLLAALAMLVGGETVFKERLSPVQSLVFWLCCLLFTLLAIWVAFRDFRALTQRVSKDQRELFESTLSKIESDARSKKDGQRRQPGQRR